MPEKSYLSTYNGKDLLKKHSLTEYGVWDVFGEEVNPEFGGPHDEPYLGLFEGVLADVIEHAQGLKGWVAWGGQGRIVKRLQTTPIRIRPDVKKLRKQREDLQKQLVEINKQLGE